MEEKIISLLMERQFLYKKANEQEYLKLYCDTQPGQNVYWDGFGEPPTISFRAIFDDKEFNRDRQSKRQLIKGRFAGGNLGWIIPEDLELFIALYRKPLKSPTLIQSKIMDLICSEGPLNIQQIKEETGLLVKEITPALHRLQEAFLLYEDQYDGEWDRSWYRFEERFPKVKPDKYSRKEALKTIILRFAYRSVYFDTLMLKSFYKLPLKEIKETVLELRDSGKIVDVNGKFMLTEDKESLDNYVPKRLNFVYAMHRNDFLVKINEHALKEKFSKLCEDLMYDHDILQYLLIDGTFNGVVVGHFRNGPYDLEDVILTLPENEIKERKSEILKAISAVNHGNHPKRFMKKIEG